MTDNMIQKNYDSFPIRCCVEEILDYYGDVTNKTIQFDTVPDYISLRSTKKEKLLIVTDNNPELYKIIKIFPIAHYQLIAWATPKKITTYVNYPDNDVFSEADKILSVCNSSDTYAKELLVNKAKIIQYVTKELPNVGVVKQFNFGPLNKDKTFIVWVPSLFNGLMWHMKRFVRSARGMKDYTSFADMQNYPNQHIAPMDIGCYNAWDVYFKPLSNYSCDEIYQSSQVIITDKAADVPDVIVTRNVLSNYMSNIEMENSKKLFDGKNNVFSVFLRGTDYIRFPWHNIPYDPYEASAIAKEYMNHYHYDYVFLNTEDENNFQVFLKEFGDKLIYLNRKRFIKGAEMPTVRHISHGFDSLDTGRDYLLETLLTARTKGIIAGPGASITPLKEFGKENNLFFDNILFKNAEGACGNKPIVLESHNKNYFKPSNFHGLSGELDISLQQDVVQIHGKVNNCIMHTVFSKSPTSLRKGTIYCCSFNTTNPNPDIEKTIAFHGTSGKIYVKKKNEKLSFPEEIDAITISLKLPEGGYDTTLSIQIEKNLFPTEYETYRYSETDFAIKGENGLLYKYEYLNALDLEHGQMNIGGKWINMDITELERINNVILYPHGFITYRHDGCPIKDISRINETRCDDLIEMVDEYLSEIPYGSMQSRTIRQLATSYLKSENKKLIDIAINKLNNHIGHPEIKYELAMAYWKGNGVEQDLSKSKQYLHDIIYTQGWKWIKVEYCDLLLQINTKESLKERLDCLNELSLQGDKKAIISLAKSYKDGIGADIDYATSAKLLKRAIDLGDSNALNLLLELYWKENTEESLKKLLKVAKYHSSKGNTNCMFYLGRMYLSGKGVKSDKKEASKWFEMVQQESNWAKNLLLDSLWNSDKDSENKFGKYVLQYSDLNLIQAIYYRGYGLMVGYGFEKDMTQSKYWLQKAADNGHNHAKKLLEQIQNGE